jgi:hypothetical protein
MDWLRSEDLKEEKNVTAPLVVIAGRKLLRSPRSNPTVSFSREIFLLCAAALVLTFFIAGLLLFVP